MQAQGMLHFQVYFYFQQRFLNNGKYIQVVL